MMYRQEGVGWMSYPPLFNLLDGIIDGKEDCVLWFWDWNKYEYFLFLSSYRL